MAIADSLAVVIILKTFRLGYRDLGPVPRRRQHLAECRELARQIRS